MDNQSVTPADVFADLLRFGAPAAVAWVKGGASAPAISGLVKFYQTPYQGVLVEAEIYNPTNAAHPNHAGDLPPVLGNEGYAWTAFYDKRFGIDEIIGRSVIIHSQADDFRSQPSGDSGSKIACGTIIKADYTG